MSWLVALKTLGRLAGAMIADGWTRSWCRREVRNRVFGRRLSVDKNFANFQLVLEVRLQ